MAYRTRDADGQPVVSRRGRDTNAIGRSPNREEYAQLMQAGWSSVALQQYALFKHGERLSAAQFQRYRRKKGWAVVTNTVLGDTQLDPDAMLDLLHERAELIRLQKARVQIDVEHEVRMRKLFSTTYREIQLLNDLISASKSDLQDLGLFPQAGQKHQVEVHGPLGGLEPNPDDGRNRFTPPAASLGELVGSLGVAEEMRLARMLHDVLPPASGNGQGVVDGEVG